MRQILWASLLMLLGSALLCHGQFEQYAVEYISQINPEIPEQMARLSEYSREAYPRLLALVDSNSIEFPDVRILSLEPVDSIPDNMALIDLHDRDRRIKIRSDLGVIAHWHTDYQPRHHYQVLINPGQQTLSVYYQLEHSIEIPIDIMAGHVLTIDAKWASVHSSGHLLRDPPFMIHDSNEPPRVIGRGFDIWARKNLYPPLESWPALAADYGIPGRVDISFDCMLYGEIKNLSVLHESPAYWGFADSAMAVFKRESWQFRNTAYAYAPYRVWSKIQFIRGRLPWPNQVRGLQLNKQLLLVPFTFPEELDTLRQPATYRYRISDGTSYLKKYSWLLVESPDSDLTIQRQIGIDSHKEVNDSTTLLRICPDRPMELHFQSADGHHFRGEFNLSSHNGLLEAVRVINPNDSAIHELELADVVVGEMKHRKFSRAGIPLFDFPIDSSDLFQPTTNIVYTEDRRDRIETMRQILLQTAFTPPDTSRGSVLLELVIDYDLQNATPNEPIPVSIKRIRVLKESPDNNNYAEFARRYMRELNWQYHPKTVAAWKKLPEELQPSPPDTILYTVDIPYFSNINKPFR